LAYSSHFLIELAERVSTGHCLLLGFALFGFEVVEQGSELVDLLTEQADTGFLVTQAALQVFHVALHFAQVTLHRQWTFAALLSAGHGDVVEAFATLREEESVGILQGEIAA